MPSESDKELSSKEDDQEVRVDERAPKVKQGTTRKARLMSRRVNPTEQAQNTLVTFYIESVGVELRYYVRLIKPHLRRGIAVFHVNKKGRPVMHRVPEYVIPENAECALILRRQISHTIEDMLFN